MIESLPPWAREVLAPALTYLPTIAGALGIIVAGWIVALIVRRAIFSALKRTVQDQKLAKLLGFKPIEGDGLERGVATAVYYVLLALVTVALFDYLNLGLVTRPLLAAFEGIAGGIPNLLKALAIGVVGYLVACLLRAITTRLLDKAKVVDRLAKLSLDAGSEEKVNGSEVSKTAGQVVFWLVLTLSAIPVLEALSVGLLAEPLTAAFHGVSTYVPRIFAAGLLVLVGYVLARLVRGVVKAVFDSMKLEERLDQWGLGTLLGEVSVGTILGTVAMAFVFLHFAISAVGRLGIPEVSEPLGLVLTQIYAYLPKLLVASVLLVFAVAISRLLSRGGAAVLAALGINRLLEEIGLGATVSRQARQQEEQSKEALSRASEASSSASQSASVFAARSGARTPADVGGMILGAIVLLLFVQQILQTLQLETFSVMLRSFLAYLPNVLVAMCVLAAGMWAGSWAKGRIDTLTERSGDRLMRSLGIVARVAIITISAMVGLEQLGVAERLIAIAFTLILGATALAFALAFGLGGREAASEILSSELRRRKSASASGDQEVSRGE